MATGQFVIYPCTECGRISENIGSLHAHAETHRGLFGLQWPWRYGDFDALMELTEVLRVDDYAIVDLEEVDDEPA